MRIEITNRWEKHAGFTHNACAFVLVFWMFAENREYFGV